MSVTCVGLCAVRADLCHVCLAKHSALWLPQHVPAIALYTDTDTDSSAVLSDLHDILLFVLG
eukprot:2655951-Rhodomonas_salina.2